MQIRYINRANRTVTLNTGSLKILGGLVVMLQNLGYTVLSVKNI